MSNPALQKTLAKLGDVFASGTSKSAEQRRADLESWIVGGDEGALARLAGRASKKAKDWRHLGLLGMAYRDEAVRARSLRLVATAKSGEELLAWIVREGSEGWITTYHRHLSESRGGPPIEAPAHHAPDERRRAALRALFAALRPDDAMLGVAFGALDQSSGRFQAWQLAESLGANERSDTGRTERRVRWLGRVALVAERNRYSVHVLADSAAVDAFLASLPPVEPKRPSEKLDFADGVVSIWMDALLDPKATLDGVGGPLGWFDHDNWEATEGPVDFTLRQLSYSASFAEAAIARAAELGLTGDHRVDALYGYRYDSVPGKKRYGWFVGSFPYTK